MKKSKLLVGLFFLKLNISIAYANECSNDSTVGSLGWVAGNIANSFQGVVQAVGAWGYVAAAVFAVLGAFKLHAWNDDPRQTPLKTPAILFIVAMLLAYIPDTVKTAKKTVWGETAEKSVGQCGDELKF